MLLLSPGPLLALWALKPAEPSDLETAGALLVCCLLLWGGLLLGDDASRKENAKRFALANACLGLFVALAELLTAAELVDYREVFRTPVFEAWSHPGNLLDPVLLHIHRPYSQVQWDSIDYRYDGHGLRNESDLHSADLVVVGDSMVEGIGVSAQALVTAQLARQLGRAVANLGQAWYGPQQELELLRRFGLILRPRVVVWAFFEGNDLNDLRRYERATKDWESFSRPLHSFQRRSFARNAFLALRRVLDGWLRPRVPSSRPYPGISGTFETRGRPIWMTFRNPGLPLTDKDELALGKLATILRRAFDLCVSADARLVVVFVPTKFRVYGPLTRFEVGARPLGWSHNDLPNRLEALVRQRLPGALFLDLTPALSREARRGSLVYFSTDLHWTPEGHHIAASAIAERVRDGLGENGWTRGAP
jgi:hypothetical protein